MSYSHGRKEENDTKHERTRTKGHVHRTKARRGKDMCTGHARRGKDMCAGQGHACRARARYAEARTCVQGHARRGNDMCAGQGHTCRARTCTQVKGMCRATTCTQGTDMCAGQGHARRARACTQRQGQIRSRALPRARNEHARAPSTPRNEHARAPSSTQRARPPSLSRNSTRTFAQRTSHDLADLVRPHRLCARPPTSLPLSVSAPAFLAPSRA